MTDKGMSDCMDSIKTLMIDNSAFWFGTNFTTRCPVPGNTLECQNFNPRATSIVARLFGNSSIVNEMTSYLDVVIHETPGK